MIQRTEIENLMQTKGNVRGEIFRANAEYVYLKKGEEGLRKIEKKMAELGCLFNFSDIKPGNWYPEAISVLFILVAKDLFDWTEKDIFEMGNSIPKFSFIPKILMKYFVSLKRFTGEISQYWRKHFDFGELELHELNEGKRYIILREKGYKTHPLMCVYHAGYYLRITQFVIKSERITIEETKCAFKGGLYHEYIIEWK